MVAVGRLPYSPKPNGPKLRGVDFVDGFLDLTGPAVDLGGIDDVVGNPLQTLSGTIADINLLSMEITHEYLAGNATSSKTVYSLTELPPDGEFSTPVSLLEGTNTFVAAAVDGSGEPEHVILHGRSGHRWPHAYTPGHQLSARKHRGPRGRPGDIQRRRGGRSRRGHRPGRDQTARRRAGDHGPRDEIPQAVLSQWQATGDFVFPGEVPGLVAPGRVHPSSDGL